MGKRESERECTLATYAGPTAEERAILEQIAREEMVCQSSVSMSVTVTELVVVYVRFVVREQRERRERGMRQRRKHNGHNGRQNGSVPYTQYQPQNCTLTRRVTFLPRNVCYNDSFHTARSVARCAD